jgi:predicted CopG family antitoxin
METTTIEISVQNWQWLTSLKQRPSDSFDDVVTRLREQHEADNLETTTGHDLDDDLDEIEPTMPDDLDLPGNGETYERRRETIATLVAYLQQEGTATKADFLQLVDADDVGYASPESFWANAVKGRNSLSAVDGVVPPGEGGHTWRYEPDNQ